jgi:hypothetical protein
VISPACNLEWRDKGKKVNNSPGFICQEGNVTGGTWFRKPLSRWPVSYNGSPAFIFPDLLSHNEQVKRCTHILTNVYMQH